MKGQDVEKVLAALQEGRFAEAQRLVGVICATYGVDAETLHLAGVTARQSGAFERAVGLLLEAIRLRPDHGRAHADLGLTYNSLGRLREAAAALETAIALGSDRVGDYVNLSAVLQHDDPARSAEVLKAAAAKWPHNGDLWLRLVRQYRRMDRPEDVVATIEAAVAALPPEAGDDFSAQVVDERAQCLFELARWEEAEPFLRQALTAGPSDRRWLYYQLGRIAMDRPAKEQDAVLAWFEHLLTERPDAGVAAGLTAMADLLAARGETGKASALLNRCKTIWSRHFTLKCLLRLQEEARAAGDPLPPVPAAEPGRPAVAATSLAYYGRFAHVMCEYLALRLYCETHGLALEIPDWVGRAVFALDEPAPRRRRPLRKSLAGRLAESLSGKAPPLTEIDIFSPGFFCDSSQRSRFARWLTPRPVWRRKLEPPLQALRARCRTLIALHLRRTDLGDDNADNLAQHAGWLADNWHRFEAPLLFVATDDETGVRTALSQFAPTMLSDIAAPWPDLEFLQDFHILRHADVLLLSHRSSFGWLAGLLNLDARHILQATPAGLVAVPYDSQG